MTIDERLAALETNDKRQDAEILSMARGVIKDLGARITELETTLRLSQDHFDDRLAELQGTGPTPAPASAPAQPQGDQELKDLLADLTDLLLQAQASGHLNPERASKLKLRALELAGRA